MIVGILTQPLEDNYGGILQNWALQQVLKQLGHEPITVDYGLKYSWNRFFLSCGKTLITRIVGGHRRFPHCPRHGRYGSKYTSEFIHNHITKTKPVKSLTSDLLQINEIKAIIVGSDQVWRPLYNKHIEDSFLEFAPDFKGVKIAYAASFGVDKWEFSEDQTKRCSSLAKQFDAISVREDSGVILCQKYLGVDAKSVLDPTLLVKEDNYLALCKNTPVNKDNFIAVYCIDITDERKKLINNASKKLEMPVIIFSANRNVELTIEEWLAMFRDASYIITDSFHGTVFSVIFKKPFLTIVNEGRGTSRFKSLLSNLGLSYRMDMKSFSEEIDWNSVDHKLIEYRNESIQFLKSSLEL